MPLSVVSKNLFIPVESFHKFYRGLELSAGTFASFAAMEVGLSETQIEKMPQTASSMHTVCLKS